MMKLVLVPVLTTVPPPKASFKAYTVPSAGWAERVADVLLTTRYSSEGGTAAVKLTEIVVGLGVSTRLVGWFDGSIQGEIEEGIW